MPWCPNCKTEYRDGFEKCNDCNADLVDSLEDIKQETAKDDLYGEGKEEFLMTVGNDIQASIIEAKLRQYDIPVLRKYREAGAYLSVYMGGTIFGIDLYVPPRLLSDAKEIVEAGTETDQLSLQGLENGNAEPEDTEKEIEEKYERKRVARTWIVLIFFIPGFIWLLFLLIKAIT